MSLLDAAHHGLAESDLAEVSTPRTGCCTSPSGTTLTTRSTTWAATLRGIYVKASGVSVDWEMLAQGLKHTDLLDVTKRCHPDTLRQVRWANAQLKEASTQILLS